ncbi:MAG TPA: hypothetical protein ENK58_02270, partial [Desulfobacterales bacterium]|nr:hypothetical protein [Desulfobacterales bacterium]
MANPPSSNIKHRTSNIKHQTSNIKFRGGMMEQKTGKRKMSTISLIVILASIFVATGFSIYDYINESRRLKTYFRESVHPISKRLANSLQKPLWFL